MSKYIIERLSCGAGDGMYLYEKGEYVSFDEYNKVHKCLDEVLDLASNCMNEVQQEMLHEILDKFGLK